MTSPEIKQATDRMFYEVGQFPQMLLDTVETGFRFKPKGAEASGILLLGMGGSGIASDIAHDISLADSRIPVKVWKYPDLPAWAGPGVIAAVSSYSGNTRETLAQYRQAMGRGCQIVVFTQGGVLGEEAVRNKQATFAYVGGVQPRSALPAGLAGYALLLDSINGTDYAGDIRRTVPDLQRLSRRYAKSDGLAHRIAESIGGRTPVIYCSSDISGTGVRWKGQVCENAKTTAGVGIISGRTELPDWSRRGMSRKCVPVFLYEEGAPKAVRDCFDACIKDVRARGADAKVVMLKGGTVLQRTLYGTLLGDYVSLFLAKARGVDPMNVPTITELKRLQSAALDP